jgi:ketohexokinase
LAEAAKLANVVFYSKIWAEYHGYTSARLFLEMQTENTLEDALLFCTWGAAGATAVQKVRGGDDIWAEVAAWKPEDGPRPVVDAIGAGDTFIAGAIFHSIARSNIDQETLQEKLEFANEMAGRKVYQDGFADLAKAYINARSEPSAPLPLSPGLRAPSRTH